MMGSSYQIGRVFGIPIKIDVTLIVLAAVMWWDYGLVRGAFAAVTLLLAIVLHELGHSLVAMRFGCRVRDITLMLIGGRATLLELPRAPWKEALMAVAGPAVSAAIGFGSIFALPFVHAFAGPVATQWVLWHVSYLNIALCIFNLLPAFPMDGGRILRATLASRIGRLRATYIASRVGRVIAVAMGLYGAYRRDFWLILIAIYIFQAAGAEYRMVQMESSAFSQDPWRRFWGRGQPPPDDQAVVSPPPYRSDRDIREIFKDR